MVNLLIINAKQLNRCLQTCRPKGEKNRVIALSYRRYGTKQGGTWRILIDKGKGIHRGHMTGHFRRKSGNLRRTGNHISFESE